MTTTRPRLVVLGTGFAGFRLLERVDVRAYEVTVISPRNHFLFTPLLPQLAHVAEQQGKYLGDVLNRRLAGKPSRPFVWKNLGISSYIGQGDAVLESRKVDSPAFWPISSGGRRSSPTSLARATRSSCRWISCAPPSSAAT